MDRCLKVAPEPGPLGQSLPGQQRVAFIRIHATRSILLMSHVGWLGTGIHFRATCSGVLHLTKRTAKGDDGQLCGSGADGQIQKGT